MSYAFLRDEKSPKILVEAVKLIGIKEVIGKDHNPKILKWAEDLGLKNIYTSDEIAWCGLFVAHVCKMAGLEPVKDPLWARNWAKWGVEQKIAMLGDVLVFERGKVSGHVGIYVGEDDKAYHVLGGNQNDQVCVTRILKSRCIAIRRTDWKVSQPKNVRVVKLLAGGVVSSNEA